MSSKTLIRFLRILNSILLVENYLELSLLARRLIHNEEDNCFFKLYSYFFCQGMVQYFINSLNWFKKNL